MGLGSKSLQKLIELTYPIHIDFECYALTFLVYPNTALVASISILNHIEYADGHTSIEPFFEDGMTLGKIFKALLNAVGKKGTLCIYSNYRNGRDKSPGRCIPKYSERLQAIARRTFDLAHLIKHHFYHPEFKGSYSLKRFYARR